MVMVCGLENHDQEKFMYSLCLKMIVLPQNE